LKVRREIQDRVASQHYQLVFRFNALGNFAALQQRIVAGFSERNTTKRSAYAPFGFDSRCGSLLNSLSFAWRILVSHHQ
jgi:hypothetical protein